MALDDTIALLRRAPLIGLLNAEALRLLAFSAEIRPLTDGEVLFRYGERSDGGYIVAQGQIAIAPRGEEPEFLVGPGSLIGRTALFARIERPATAAAREEAEVVRISPMLMRRVLAEFPAAAAALRHALASDLDELSADLAQVEIRLRALGA